MSQLPDGGRFLDGCRVEENAECNGEAPRALVEHWRRLCEISDPSGPHWSDVDLMEMRHIAPNMIVKDIVSDGAEYRNRYWGTRVAEAFLFDATGLCLADYYEPRHVKQLKMLYELAVADKRPLRIYGDAVFYADREFVRFEAAHVPIFDADGKPSHVLIAYDFFPKTSDDTL